jgi:hypothetical protein
VRHKYAVNKNNKTVIETAIKSMNDKVIHRTSIGKRKHLKNSTAYGHCKTIYFRAMALNPVCGLVNMLG